MLYDVRFKHLTQLAIKQHATGELCTMIAGNCYVRHAFNMIEDRRSTPNLPRPQWRCKAAIFSDDAQALAFDISRPLSAC